jgi:hypothetical protein
MDNKLAEAESVDTSFRKDHYYNSNLQSPPPRRRLTNITITTPMDLTYLLEYHR